MKMNQPLVELQDICRFISGGTPSTKVPEYFAGTIPWITGADMSGNVITEARQYITKEAIQHSATNIVPKGNILLVTRTGVGKVAIAGVDICISQDFTGLELDKTKVDEWYLFYFLLSQQEALTSQQRGATIQGITRDVVETLRIPLPPLTEQKRIASLLARADRLRQLRRTAHDLSDSVLQSVFLEMFGDALTGKNPKIPLVPLETLCTKITDGTHVTPNYIESGVPFISIKDLTRTPGTIDFSDTKFISREEHKKISKLSNVERDDILYTKVGSYGIAQIVDTDQEFSIFVSVALLKPDKSKILPKFFEVVMNSSFVKKQADMLVSGIGVPDLHLREIKTFQIPLPPLSLQEEFAGVVARVESLRGRMGESTRQVEGLFESLLAEAFS
jgi:type I restriction enzyme S subunit